MNDLRERLMKSEDFDEIFKIVKEAVEKSLNVHRAGLALALADLPSYIGAYHQLGSNFIVVNKAVLNLVKGFAKSREEFNAFVFTILAHEYLHSLGYTGERDVRNLVRKISIENFGEEHTTTRMALGSLMDIYPQLRLLGEGRVGEDFEIIKDFEKSSVTYIG